MISVKAIENAGEAGHYFFGIDNYYLDNSADLEQTTSWWGEGAKQLNLEGTVSGQVFTELLDGKLPNGDLLGRIRSGLREHRAGIDLTFSVPKSVSILAEVCGIKEIHLAHEMAVNDTLELIQKECAETRIFKDGKSSFVTTNNLTIAKLRHDVSRALDPQLHTHCIVMNMTLWSDGKWRSLARQDSRTLINANTHGFLERVYENQRYFGAYYRSSLAYHLKELNYKIVRTHKDNRFEIANVPPELIKLYSKRRQQIEANLQEKGLGGAKASSIAALNTRIAKAPADRKELHEQWQNEAKSLGISLEQIAKNAKAKDIEISQGIEMNSSLRTPEQAVDFAIKHLSEREACFSQNQLVAESASYILGDVHPKAIFNAIEVRAKDGKLIDVSKTSDQNQGKQSPMIFTTPEAIVLEKATIKLMQDGKQICTPILAAEKVAELLDRTKSNILENIELTKGQKQAVEMILTAKDRIVGVQGDPGTGKTTMFKVVKAAAESEGYRILGLATSANAARQLHKETGIKSMTLSAYLVAAERMGNLEKNKNENHNSYFEKESDQEIKKEFEREKSLKDTKTIIIVDEASQVSSSEMHTLLQETAKGNIRVIPVGDIKQIDPILAGRPFYQLQQNGMQTTTVKEILRQKDQNLRASVDLAIQRDIAKSIEKLGCRLHVIENKDERLAAMADLYLSYSHQERGQIRVGVGSREDRDAINLLIRSGLRSEGMIYGQELSVKVLVPLDLTLVEKCTADYYKIGSIVRFNKTYFSLRVTKNDYLTVINIDKKNNIVTLINSNNKLISWDPEKTGGKRKGAVEVFETREQKLAVGDVIRWTRNNYQDNIYNGATARVVKIKNNYVTLQQQGDFGSEKTIKIDLNKFKNQHWDYAYSLTVHGLQGDTCDRILVNQDAYNKNLTTQKSFLVAISRARNEAHVFTNNKDEYINVLQKYTGEKTTALDSLLAKELLLQNDESKKTEAANVQDQDKGDSKSNSSVQENHQKHNQKNQFWDANAILAQLTNRAEEVVTHLLGEPKKVSGNFWRYGSNKGSLIITMGGDRRGLWYDFQINKGGNLLTLFEEKMNLDFKGALEYAGKFLGLSRDDLVNMSLQKSSKNQGKNKSLIINLLDPIKAKEKTRSLETKKSPLSEHQLKMQKYAIKLERTSFSAKNTVVERYLREHRKIELSLPSSIRFHPGVWDSSTKQTYPAMLAIAKDKNGKTQAVQVTYLDPITAKKAQIEQPKRTFGLLRGAAVKINTPRIRKLKTQSLISSQQLKPTITAIAEGVETALSVTVARPDLQVYATLGVANFANFQYSPQDDQRKNCLNQLVIFADNDGKNSDSQKLIDRVVNKFSEQGINVMVITPPKAGQDFNDVLRENGALDVRKIIDRAECNVTTNCKTYEEIKKTASNENISELAKFYDLMAQEKLKDFGLYEYLTNNAKIFEKTFEQNSQIHRKAKTAKDFSVDNSIRDSIKVDNGRQQQDKVLTQDFERF